MGSRYPLDRKATAWHRATVTRYTLGDSPLAADRLALLAQVFEPTTSAFVDALAPPLAPTVIDLGCGPGHTTALLASVRPGATVVGLDASAAFVERARRTYVGHEFHHHDVTDLPLPVASPDLMFARFLLAHLSAPDALVARWLGELAPGGRLLVEENDEITSTNATFQRYEQISSAMITSTGGDLYVGRTLIGHVPDGATVLHSEVVDIVPPTAIVARLFTMNLATWRHDPWTVANVATSDLDRLAHELDELGTSEEAGELTFRNRQLAYERA
jgi:trans-aconitate 2-methyltransferase